MRPRQLSRDERAIEGLPIRLVIALVVGIASLSLMMNTLGGIQTLGVTELDAKPTPEVIGTDATDLEVGVVGPDGERVSNATIVAKSGTAQLADIQTATTDEHGTATLSISPSLGPNQDEGTLEFSIKPPAGKQYADERANTEVLVVSD